MRRTHYLVVILLLIAQTSFGQIYQNMAQPGYKFSRARFDSVLTIPMGLGNLKNISGGQDTGQIRFNKSDSSVYVWNGRAWIKPVGGGTDTASLSNRINLKLNISDTAAMLSPYAKTAALGAKLNISDTATMLSAYARSAAVTSSLALKLNISDTATMLSNYAKTAAVNLKLNISDTATMLAPYSRVTVSSYGKNAGRDSTILLLSNGTRFAARDSIGGGGTDTTSLSNRINLKQNLVTLTTTGTSGAATFNQSTGALNIPSYSGGGSSQTLQQTVAIGNTATNAFYSLDSIKAANLVTSGGGMFGDSTFIGTDTVYVYGASIETGQGATAPENWWVNKVGVNLGATIINRAIASSSFTKFSNGDSSFMDRLPNLPTYRSTRRYIVIGTSNLLNDLQLGAGTANMQSSLSRAIDTLRINRGWPLNRIIISIPGVIGYKTAAVQNDSLGVYARAAISTSIIKGVPYVDNYNYTKTYGGSANLNSDSIHPTNTGHYLLSEGFTYKVSDVKILNSIRANRDILTKGNITVGNKLILSTTSGTVGNVAGQINMGNATNGNNILAYDGGNTLNRTGIGFNTSNGNSAFFGRGSGSSNVMFGVGVDMSDISTLTSAFYLNRVTQTPVANANAFSIFNGTTNMFNLVPTKISFGTTVANAAGVMNFGNVAIAQGVLTLDAGSTTLRAGMIYNGAAGPSYLFGRGNFNYLFGVGFDNTNLTTSNAAFYINTTNRLVLQGSTTSAGTASLKLIAGTKLTTPEAGAIEYVTGKFVVQNDGITFGATAGNASAKLEVQSTTQGVLFPRMTTTQKNAIASPAAGLVVYDTTLNKLCVYTTTWETITSL